MWRAVPLDFASSLPLDVNRNHGLQRFWFRYFRCTKTLYISLERAKVVRGLRDSLVHVMTGISGNQFSAKPDQRTSCKSSIGNTFPPPGGPPSSSGMLHRRSSHSPSAIPSAKVVSRPPAAAHTAHSVHEQRTNILNSLAKLAVPLAQLSHVSQPICVVVRLDEKLQVGHRVRSGRAGRRSR